jgi:hypothetical protein
MPVSFTPQFFSKPTLTPAASTLAVSTPAQDDTHSAVQDPKHKKYSTDHQIPKHINPRNSKTMSLSNASQHYADIDWTKHEAIMQDGSRVRFGSPRFGENKKPAAH